MDAAQLVAELVNTIDVGVDDAGDDDDDGDDGDGAFRDVPNIDEEDRVVHSASGHAAVAEAVGAGTAAVNQEAANSEHASDAVNTSHGISENLSPGGCTFFVAVRIY